MALTQGFLCSRPTLPAGEAVPRDREAPGLTRAGPLGLLSSNGGMTGSIRLGLRPGGAPGSLLSIKHLPLVSPSPETRVLVGSTSRSHFHRGSPPPFLGGASANLDQNGTGEKSPRAVLPM